MRSLTKKQTKYLDYLVGRGIATSTDMTDEMNTKLEEMNDYETLWSDTDRYFHVKVWDRINNTK